MCPTVQTIWTQMTDMFSSNITVHRHVTYFGLFYFQVRFHDIVATLPFALCKYYDISSYLRSFLDSEMVQVAAIPPSEIQVFVYSIKSIPMLLMSWRRKEEVICSHGVYGHGSYYFLIVMFDDILTYVQISTTLHILDMIFDFVYLFLWNNLFKQSVYWWVQCDAFSHTWRINSIVVNCNFVRLLCFGIRWFFFQLTVHCIFNIPLFI